LRILGCSGRQDPDNLASGGSCPDFGYHFPDDETQAMVVIDTVGIKSVHPICPLLDNDHIRAVIGEDPAQLGRGHGRRPLAVIKIDENKFPPVGGDLPVSALGHIVGFPVAPVFRGGTAGCINTEPSITNFFLQQRF